MKTNFHDPTTLLEALRKSLSSAGEYNASDTVAPVAVLWTDGDGQWQGIAEKLREIMPELLTLGEYDAKKKTGPAIWLRCAIERMLPEVELAPPVPVLYLPHVNCRTLRAAEECPDSLKSLVELQYRGSLWTQKNGKDWTVEAFLVSEDGGLGLSLAKDRETRRAMLNVLEELLFVPLAKFRGKRLEAEDFNRLMVSDIIRDSLVWLSDPADARSRWPANKWQAFCSTCRSEYELDPEKDGELSVIGKIASAANDTCREVWQRYRETPGLYPGIRSLLIRAKPGCFVFEDEEYWPNENEKQEKSLREELGNMKSLAPTEARRKIHELEERHGKRRDWAWARLGESNLANALEYLQILAHETCRSLSGDSLEAMAQCYRERGYTADDAALQAIAAAKSAQDKKAVGSALQSIYRPWLDDAAKHFQKLTADEPLPRSAPVSASPGECLFFVDGLRFDVAQKLIAMARAGGLEVQSGWRWAALPTITATAKPAVSPVASLLTGESISENFAPRMSGQSLTRDRFYRMLKDAGYEVWEGDEIGEPEEDDRGWTEYGKFDKLGHDLQGDLAERIYEELNFVMERLRQLLDSGWKQVRIVTDHGWLLLPGGLPKTKLPKYLTQTLWGRCASLKATSKIEIPTSSWYWNPGELFAHPPGASSFVKGMEYAHGGLSLEECLIPDLVFAKSEAVTAVTIENVQWLGMRCRVTLANSGREITVDLRARPGDPKTSIVEGKNPDADGTASLLVPDDSLEGKAVYVVVTDACGRVLAEENTIVGGG